MVEPEWPQMTIWLRVALSIMKATRTQEHARARALPPPTHTQICNTYYSATINVVSSTRLDNTLYVLCLSFFFPPPLSFVGRSEGGAFVRNMYTAYSYVCVCVCVYKCRDNYTAVPDCKVSILFAYSSQ
jgi:hypothetical protein